MPHRPSLTLFLLALTLLVRAAVPVGWMPSSAADRLIAPCPADWPALEADPHAHHGENEQHGDGPDNCAFAPLLSGADLPLPAALPAPTVTAGPPPTPQFFTVRLPRGPPALPPPSTGPPAVA